MGYYTDYTLELIEPGEVESLESLLPFTSPDSDLASLIEGETNLKWYDHEEDMKEFSKQFPDVLFLLEGEGEEAGDLWKKYFKAGKVQVCKAEIVYPPYSPEALA